MHWYQNSLVRTGSLSCRFSSGYLWAASASNGMITLYVNRLNVQSQVRLNNCEKKLCLRIGSCRITGWSYDMSRYISRYRKHQLFIYLRLVPRYFYLASSTATWFICTRVGSEPLESTLLSDIQLVGRMNGQSNLVCPGQRTLGSMRLLFNSLTSRIPVSQVGDWWIRPHLHNLVFSSLYLCRRWVLQYQRNLLLKEDT